MTDAILPFVEDVMSSPWIYMVLFAIAALDGVLPVVPSETSVLTAGVFAASGETSLPLVILAAALGAFAGDQVSYAFGIAPGHAWTRVPVPGAAAAPRWIASARRSRHAAASSSSSHATSPARAPRSRSPPARSAIAGSASPHSAPSPP